MSKTAKDYTVKSPSVPSPTQTVQESATLEKFPLTIRDSKSGRIIVLLVDSIQTVGNLREKIAKQESFHLNSMKITLLKKELADETRLETLRNENLELFARPIPATLAHASSRDVLRLTTAKEKQCVSCGSRAADNCSTCGKPVCQTCGHWKTNIQASAAVDEEALLASPTSPGLVSNNQGMEFFTQCPKCRTRLAQKSITMSRFSASSRKKLAIAAVAVLILLLVIFSTL